ncbi:CBS domain-containing protein [Azospirillum sp. RWY-5-1]|uniref:CBS domain-containing protein n=1 Tax=Azospirillum oleiclasticum TaxID=2735135 RepID=A0ABX2TBW9_9PROT|nr:CBS domain-containing protein [Azospirillum oleiclasticum]NYZ14310.1 CBS domain-containing protein [Azospirillum oleiclasticum]NYZ21795.1 CBS domain-containing protein [Azospirillum oleiclasticum]
MHVAAVLKRKGADVVTVRPGDSIGDVARTLTRHRIGAVVVMEENGSALPCGIVSERDIVRAIAADGAAALDRPASDLMTRQLVTATPADTVAHVMSVMTERRIRHVPIIEDERMVGVISIGDVVKTRLDETEMEVESLRDFVAGIG